MVFQEQQAAIVPWLSVSNFEAKIIHCHETPEIITLSNRLRVLIEWKTRPPLKFIIFLDIFVKPPSESRVSSLIMGYQIKYYVQSYHIYELQNFHINNI